MKTEELARRMRRFEVFSQRRLDPEARAVLRLDGRGFSRLTKERFEKPFDRRFHEAMRAVAGALMEELQGRFAYVQSDEVSVALPPGWRQYGGRVEKVVSLSAGLASVVFSEASGARGIFDARVWQGPDWESVIDYFRWRQGDALRCGLNSWCFWHLRGEGVGERAATEWLRNLDSRAKLALMRSRGIAEPEPWQRVGVGLRFERFVRGARDRRSQRAVEVIRRRLRIDEHLPEGRAFEEYLAMALGEEQADLRPA